MENVTLPLWVMVPVPVSPAVPPGGTQETFSAQSDWETEHVK
jgi:hypothetical protein